MEAAAAAGTTAAAAFTGEYACVFCGSKEGQTPAFAAAAKGLANVLLQRGLGLVYGGGTVGLMGIVSRTVRLTLLLLLTRARALHASLPPPR
jgi:predicted Rossmann-fold nucleotide-binding protein